MHTLARDLSRTVGELREMDADEYADWEVLYQVEAEEREHGPRKQVISDPVEIRRFFAQNK